jgi:hypothetical protein
MMGERRRALGESGEWTEMHGPPERVPAMRRFFLDRAEDVTGASGVGCVAEGVAFTDGTVALRWLTTLRSTAIYNHIDDVAAIHGHDGLTTVVWMDE